MRNFQPDYTNMIAAATNKQFNRMPLYEHGVSPVIMEKILNKNFIEYFNGDENDIKEFTVNFIEFYKQMGYDVVSYDHNIGDYMPGSGALLGEHDGVIKNREDFLKYPWHTIKDAFFERTAKYFRILGEVMPEGMKAIGGPGNGIYECVVDVVGYTNLCYISVDDPELYADLFKKVGEINYSIWKHFLENFGDTYAVCRFGDDLGFRSSTLIPPDDIKNYIVPQYKKIIELVHSFKKPFVYHSCGKTFEVIDDIIDIAKIDAKHSNEDAIAPFTDWVDKYGTKIGNFGGLDVDVVCRGTEQEIKEKANEIINYTLKKKENKGFAFGSGNSIPDYVPVSGYLAMIEAARTARGE